MDQSIVSVSEIDWDHGFPPFHETGLVYNQPRTWVKPHVASGPLLHPILLVHIKMETQIFFKTNESTQ
jgi:hypothetical protein